ncbi:MAG TPA: Arm DNA-binding domain-containing protein [Accumulibacter sp.]|nr:Arm DNA-binding domain-containing protein [Accumulibacter sp.]HQC81084.1 Arm DNA-binding domain-containing protein [Accumulibacter sp.]
MIPWHPTRNRGNFRGDCPCHWGNFGRAIRIRPWTPRCPSPTSRYAKPTQREASQNVRRARGLFIIAPAGGKGWRFRYGFGDKEKPLSLGVYPDVRLKEAREARRGAQVDRQGG